MLVMFIICFNIRKIFPYNLILAAYYLPETQLNFSKWTISLWYYLIFAVRVRTNKQTNRKCIRTRKVVSGFFFFLILDIARDRRTNNPLFKIIHQTLRKLIQTPKFHYFLASFPLLMIEIIVKWFYRVVINQC